MPQDSCFRRLKGYTTRTSVQHSVSSLGIDLKKDTLSILQDLLTGIYNDFMVIYQPYNRSDPTLDVSTQQRIVARLNVLVLISKRVFQALPANSSLRIPLLQAVYHILRLPLWHYNRSLRCSALRCLRYYVHSAQDMELLLKCRLDLLISRCMDLSYHQSNVVPSNKLIGNSTLRGVDYQHHHHQPHHHRARFVIPYDSSLVSPTPVSSYCQPSKQSPSYQGNESIDQLNEMSRKGVSVTRFRRSSPAKDYSGLPIKSSLTTRNTIESSYMPGATSERPAVLRLIYHLVNLSPHLIPPSLIHAIAAPCLDALNYTIMSPDDKRGFRGGGGGGGGGRGHACVVTGGLRRRTSPTGIIHYPLCTAGDLPGIGMKLNDTNYDTEVDTTTIRSCLLILSELVILAPERLTVDTSSSFVRHSKIKSPAYCFHQENASTAPGSNNNNATKEPLPVVGRTIIHALMSTFAYTSTMYTYHSSRIHEAVMLTLITILNRSDYAQFLPNRVISKFFVAYTSTSHSLLHRKSSFDTYPSFTLCARNALILMFRSWPGIFHFTRDGVSNLKTLLYTLAVGSTENRNQILDLLYSLFPTIPVPHPSVKDMEPTILGLIEALSTGSSSLLPVMYAPNSNSRKKTNIFTTAAAADEMSSLPKSRRFVSSILPVRRPSSSSNTWDIDGGFIAAEGCRLFSKYDSIGFDVMNNYYALLLAILIQAGLYEALMRAISDSNQVTSIRAGYLLGSLAYKVESLLPHEHPVCKRLHQVGLLRPETPGSQLAVLWLERIHRVMQSHEARLRDPSNFISVPYHSPFLECLAKRSVDASSSSSPARHSAFTDNMELTDATLDHLIASSNVLSFKAKSQHGRFSQCQMTTTSCSSKPPDVWDWDILTTLGRRLAVTRTTFSWESKSRSKFLRSLMEFLTPDETYRRDLTSSSDKYAPALPTIGRSLSSIPNKPSILPADSLFNVVINGNRSCLQQNLDYCTNLQGIDRLLYNRENKLFSNNDNICKEINPKDDNFNLLSSHLVNSSNAYLNLAWLSHDWPHASAAGILASGLISHLAYYSPTSEPSQFLDRFLTVLHLCLKFTLSKITTDSSINGENLPEEKSSSDNSIPSNNNNIDNTNDNANLILLFSPKLLNKSCSSLILLAASQLTTSDVGESRLEKNDLCIDFQSILMFPSKLKRHGTSVTTDSQKYFLCHAKVILSSLDYSRPSKMSRMLLTTAAIQGIKALRIYTIRLIRLLFRLKLPFLASWCIDLVVKLCMDPSKKVRRLALCLLEELCWDPANVQALSQNILQRNSQTKDKRSSILTCFAAYLLNTNTGPIGHRIFSRVLSITNVFDQLYMHKIIKQPNSLVGYVYDGRERNNNNKLKNCHIPSDNPHNDFIDTSPDNDKLSSVINPTPRPPGDEDDDDHYAEVNDTNGDNDQASILCDPINWILDIAKKYYNEAYAKDMDTRLTSMFVTYETRKSTNASYANAESHSKNLLLPVISIMGLEKSSYVNFTTDNDENDRDHDDDDDDLEDSVDHPSNTEFTFEDNYFIEGADNNADDDGHDTYYLPPPLSTARSVSYHKLSNGCDSYHCLALLKHPYGCLAEHRHGIDLLDKRMDLELAVANIRAYESRLSSRNTTTAMMDENFEKFPINDTNTLLKLKADMWALAHACSTSFGQLWLSKHPELVKLFTNITLHSSTMSVRAIAWICLNLITSCPNGYFRKCQGSSISAKNQQACSEPLDCDELTNDWPFIPYTDNNNNNNESSHSNKNNASENVISDNLEFHTTLQPNSAQLDAVKFDQDAFQSDNGLLSDVYDVVGPSVHYETEHKTDKHVVDRKPSKPSIRSQVVENLNRSRRRWWFHRHCSPNHRRFSPPACESSSFFSNNPQQRQQQVSCNRSNHSSLTSSSQLPAFICEISPRGNNSLLSSSQQPYLTWTHRNCIQHRQTVLTAPLTSSRLTPVCDHDTVNNDNNKSIIDHSWTSSADVYLTNKRQLICLPKDIHILGNKKYTTVENTYQFIQQSSIFANQSFTCRQFDRLRCSMTLSNAQKSSCKPFKSFIDVAVDAQMLLSAYSQRKCSSTLSSIPADEISVDTSNPDGVINSGTSDNENQLYSSDSIQVTGASNCSSSHDGETSRKVSLKSDELMKQISLPPLSTSNSLLSSESCLLQKDAESRPPAPPAAEGKLDVISNWLISSDDDVNKTNLATSENIKLSSHNNTPTETLMYPNTPLDPSPIPKTANDTDNDDNNTNNKASGGKSSCRRQSSGFSPDGCLSLSCLASLNVNNDCQCDEAVLTEQNIWYNQLVDSICSLMPSVFSSSRGDTGLDHLIKKAVKLQQSSKGAIQLFNACTYTLIADLLGAYTFSRQARTKIQSVFLCFQLDELLVDANNSLTELEKCLTSSNR